MEKKRKLKPLIERQPDKSVTQAQIAAEISERTGFTKVDILNVLRVFGNVAREKVAEGYKVPVSKIGTIYPLVRVSRYSHVLKYKTGGDGLTKDQYVPQMKFNRFFKSDLKKIEVPKEVIEAQYAD